MKTETQDLEKDLEKDIEKYLVTAIKSLGGKAYKFTSPARRSVPDRLCVFPKGKHCFVEVKRLGGKLTPLQSVEIKQLTKLDHKVFVIYSKVEVRNLMAFIRDGGLE